MSDSNSEQHADLFPIDLSSIEKFHYFDSSDAYPNIIGCCLRLSVRIDKKIARQAWEIAKSRQPFCHVEISENQWVHRNPETPTTKAVENEFQFLEYKSRPTPWRASIDSVDKNAGPYLAIRQWPEDAQSSNQWRSEIWLWAHHCLADGAGSLSFINDWIRVYQNLKSGRDAGAGLRSIDATLIHRRNHLGLMERKFLRHLPHQLVGMFGATKFVFRKTADPNSELTTCSESESSKPFPCLHGMTVTDENVRLIARHAKQIGVSQNSILMASVFQVVDQWRRKKSQSPVQPILRLVLPINIRQWRDRRMPAVNRASIVQLDRNSPVQSDISSLSQSIDHEVKIIKNWQLDKMFLILIRMISIVPNGLINAAKNPKSRGYAVFTNLGRPFASAEKAGLGKELIPDSIDFFGPIRKGTPLNFSFADYGRELRITLHFDPSLVTTQDAESLLDDLAERLTTLESGSLS